MVGKYRFYTLAIWNNKLNTMTTALEFDKIRKRICDKIDNPTYQMIFFSTEFGEKSLSNFVYSLISEVEKLEQIVKDKKHSNQKL